MVHDRLRASMEYARPQPEQSVLYQVIEEYYPAFLSHLSESEKSLPQYVQTEHTVNKLDHQPIYFSKLYLTEV